MVTSCYRRMGAYQKAMVLYEQIHQDYPENLECLRYLVAICKDQGTAAAEDGASEQTRRCVGTFCSWRLVRLTANVSGGVFLSDTDDWGDADVGNLLGD
jgi:hypothetical protein